MSNAPRLKAIYVLENPERPGECKVGISGDPLRRAGSLAGTIYWHSQLRDDAALLERKFARRHSEAALGGEWFGLKPDAALTYIRQLIAWSGKPDVAMVEPRIAVSVRLEPDTIKRMKHAALDANMTVQDWVAQAVRDRLAQREIFSRADAPSCDSKDAPSALETREN